MPHHSSPPPEGLDLTPFEGRRIAVLMGGESSEREVSLRSGEGVLGVLERQGFKAFALDPGPDFITQLAASGAEVCFNALHGGVGEDGTLSAVLDLLGIPYTGCGLLASALAMNKHQAKRLFRAVGLPTTDWAYLESGCDVADVTEELIEELRLPCVVKPVDQGSSVGVTIAHTGGELAAAITACLELYGAALAERYIRGTEITIGVIGVGERRRALPVLQLVPHGEFYDYEHKYTEGMTDFICPARIPEEAAEAAQHAALTAFTELGCAGISRVDMHLDEAGQLWIHEVNSVPGMTELSDVPAEARAAGMTYDDLVLEILASAAPRMPH